MSTVSSTSQGTVSPQLLAMLNGKSGSSTGSGSATSAASQAAAAGSAQSIQNEFLTLFTTQLKNQDPLNPMDSSQMTSQLAQISTVSGIQQLDSTVQSMMTSNTALQTAQSASLIGHDVMGPGSKFSLAAGSGAQLGVSLQSPADALTVTVLDSNGVPVKSFDLGAQTNTVVPIAWDGSTVTGVQAPAGNYTLTTQASLNGKAVTATPLVQGKVTGVTSSSAGISLEVAGVGTVALGTVAQIN